MNIETASLTEVVAALRARQIRSQELVEELLRIIHRRDSTIGAYLWLNEEEALSQARAADEARAQGKDEPLLGIPVAVKDNMNVRGQPCTCASRILQGYIAPYDATVIARLRAAGALFLGRTNMDEFAMGSSTENSAFHITRNPFDPTRVPGGSSGGSAAAVAAGEALAALGSDTGGSIRQPAALCGCVGLKPTYGRVSRYGLVAFASSLDQIGPLTRTVKDAAVLMNVLAGHDERDATTAPCPVPDYTADLQDGIQGLRLGLPREYFVAGIAADVREAVTRAADVCENLGAHVEEVSLPHTEYAIPTYYIVATAEASANLARFDGVRYGRRTESAGDVLELYSRTRGEGFGPEVKRRIILGTYVLSSGYYEAYYGSAQKVRTLIRQDFDRVFQQCDALLTPTSPTAAFRLGEKTADPLQMYLADVFTATANLAGLCGLSVPCGWNAEGLPIGLQILGPAFGEGVILRVGHAVEQALRCAHVMGTSHRP